MNYRTFSKLWKRFDKLMAIEFTLYTLIIIVIYIVVLFLI
jgi:hypothetical protein